MEEGEGGEHEGAGGSGWRRAKVGRMRRGRGEWIEEGKGREVEDDKGQGLRREWM